MPYYSHKPLTPSTQILPLTHLPTQIHPHFHSHLPFTFSQPRSPTHTSQPTPSPAPSNSHLPLTYSHPRPSIHIFLPTPSLTLTLSPKPFLLHPRHPSTFSCPPKLLRERVGYIIKCVERDVIIRRKRAYACYQKMKIDSPPGCGGGGGILRSFVRRC